MEKNYVSLTIANFKITLKKFTKNQKKIEKLYFGSKLSEANNDYTNKKITKIEKKSKIIFWSKLSETNNDNTKKIDKYREKIRKMWLRIV